MSVRRSRTRLSWVLGGAMGIVACEVTVGPREHAQWGALQILVNTQGTRLNPVDYMVSLDSARQGYGFVRTLFAHLRNIPADSVDISPVLVGAHHVTLLGVSSNCTVAFGNNRVVRVRPDELLIITFDVSCAPPP